MLNVYEAVDANKRKSVVIVFLFVAFVTTAVTILSYSFGSSMGYEFGGLGYAGMAFIVSGLMSLGSYYYSDKIILAISQARPADSRRDHIFYSVTQNLSMAASLPMPKLYVINDSAPNAFATGRDPDHAVVCATTGLLEKLDRTELEGVIGHELTHVRNYDIRLASIVTVLVGIVALLADWFLRMSWRGGKDNDRKSSQLDAIIMVIGIIFAILSPVIAQLIQLAISRRREFLADAGSVMITRQPSGLISALQKLTDDKEPLEVANKATENLYIVNPFKNKGNGAVALFANLFNTHPPLTERIKALQAMA